MVQKSAIVKSDTTKMIVGFKPA